MTMDFEDFGYNSLNKGANKKIIALCLSVLFLLVALSVWGYIYATTGSTEEQPVVSTPARTQDTRVFEDLALQARAVYVYDVTSQRPLYSENAFAPLPLASLSKIMTSYLAAQELQDKNIRITGSDLQADGDSGLFENEEWRSGDLIDFTLLVSSNDGARALASAFEAFQSQGSGEKSFVDRMNDTATDLDLTTMRYTNASGLDAEDLTESGGYASARDMTLLVDHVLRESPEVLSVTREEKKIIYSESGIAHEAENTNELVNDIPFLIASKTGFTDLAGGNLVVVFDVGINKPVIATVLGSTKEGRFSDMYKLYRATMEYIQAK